MYISQRTAQAIVNEIGNEIHEHINMMDSTGCIIASTDSSRVGMIHGGAKRIIEEQLEELYITPEMEDATTRTGINLPVKISNEIVGVIGITGEKSQVEQFGNIVRHITEIMVEDSITKDERRFDRRVRYRFLESWLKSDGVTLNQHFIDQGNELGIDIEKPRRIIIFRLADFITLSATLEGQKKLDAIETTIRSCISEVPDALFLREPTRQICFLPACSDERMQEFAQRVRGMILNRYGEHIMAGVDGHRTGDVLMHNLCIEAGKAVDSCNGEERWMVFYAELDVEVFLNEIPEESRREYLRKLFEHASYEEMQYYMKVMRIYFECDGSIQEASKRLFMHKNTLQYKLHKIEEITGHDIRKPVGAAVLYMALSFYYSIYGSDFFLRV